MLNNFFRINMPYGMKELENGEWILFNREYKLLGTNNSSFNLPDEYLKNYSVKYGKFTKNWIENFFTYREGCAIEEYSSSDGNKKMKKIFFYNDATNPVNVPKKYQESCFSNYFEILKHLSFLKNSDPQL